MEGEIHKRKTIDSSNLTVGRYISDHTMPSSRSKNSSEASTTIKSATYVYFQKLLVITTQFYPLMIPRSLLERHFCILSG